jgi:DNA-binding LacI/PurR family transcriptional regulator
MPTLRDIAKAAKVSPATASRALSDHPAVAPATRRAVQAAARRLGWRPDPMLRALARYRWPGGRGTGPATVIILCDRWTRMNRVKLAVAHDRASALGWNLQIHSAWDRTRQATGIIVDMHEDCRADLPWERLPVVIVGEERIPVPCDRVTTDWRQVFDLVRAHLPGKRLGCAVFPFAGNGLTRVLHAEALVLHAETGGPPPLMLTATEESAQLSAWLRRHRPDAVLCADSLTPRLLLAAGVQAVRLGGPRGPDLQLPMRMAQAIDLLHARLLAGGSRAAPVTVLVPGTWNPSES